MNMAIEITCLLIAAAEEGIELKVDGDRLKIRAPADIDAELRNRLQTHKTAIIERLNYEAAHLDPFGEFVDGCCLFYTGDGMATPIAELDAAYRHWAKDNGESPASLVQLHKRLRCLGCQKVPLQGTHWWEHIGLILGWEQAEKRP